MAEAATSYLVKKLGSVFAEATSSISVRDEISWMEETLKNMKGYLADAEKTQLKDSDVERWLDQFKDLCYETEDLLDEWSYAIIKSQLDRKFTEDDRYLYKIQRTISKFKGVETVDIDGPKNQVTVKGTIGMTELTQNLKEKLKTRAVFPKKDNGSNKKEKEGSSIRAGDKEQLEGGCDVDEEVQKLQILKISENIQARDHTVKLPLDKVKRLFYEAADNVLLDERNTEKIKSKLKEEAQKEEAENTPVLKEKVNKLSLPHDFEYKIKILRQKLDVIDKSRLKFGFKWNFRPTSDEIVEQPNSTASADIFDICGRDKDKDDLVINLLGRHGQEERSPHVISIFGIGGVGKTTLAQVVYNDDAVKAHFERRMWVRVSEPFDEIRVVKAIIGNHDGDSSNVTDLSKLFQRLLRLIRGNKFLLVLDDFCIEDSMRWEPFRIVLKYGSRGSRILVTTRKMEVARMMGSAYTTNLNVLSSEDCWSVFRKLVFSEKDPKQYQLLEDLGWEISKKCKGLPLAAKILGSFMRFKKCREDWKNVLHSNLWDFEDVKSCLFAPLLLSYNDLPPVLRQCFLYCAIFPKDAVILVKDLIQLWMAQNYLGAKGCMKMEILGHQYFEVLAMRSLFQDLERHKDDGRIISCKMHDLVHDFVRLQMKNECFAIVVDGKQSTIGSFSESNRHLSIKFTRETQFPASVTNAKNLRTLITSNIRHVSINTILPNLFQHLKFLRALNLSSCSIEKLPYEIEKLIHLRFLDLSSNYDIEELPETMCKLCNLQTLNVSSCYMLERLPEGMGQLIRLRHLILDGTDYMKMFPKGFGRLKSLRTLSKFIVSGNDEIKGCKVEELKNMNHLEGALEIKGLGNVIDVLEAKKALLEKKIHLRCLCLDFDRGIEKYRKMENDLIILDALKPHPDLEQLEISGTIMFPKWMMSLTKLRKLKLSSFWKSKPLPPLGKLPFLESLEIMEVDGVKKVGVEFLGIQSNDQKDLGLSLLYLFPNLKFLKFQEMRGWEEWDSIGGIRKEGDGIIMPKLRCLNIMNCPKLRALPEFLEATSLEELYIEYCPRISNCKMLLTRLTRLKVLVIKQCKSLDHLPSFGNLPFLELLSLWSVDSVKKVGGEFLGIESNYEKEKALTSSLTLFPKLRSLEFWSFKEWEEWDGIRGMGKENNVIVLPHLHSLIIYNCPKLKSLPHFLQTAPLKDLRISGCPIIKKSCQRKTGYDWPKISHIPNIEIND